jgi:hypothetical protein
MMRNILLAIAIIAVLGSCKHSDYVEQIIESPVFSISGFRNGEAFSIAAGENGLVQKSVLTKNNFGIIEWQSTFENMGCSSCATVFKLTAHDRQGAALNDCLGMDLFNRDNFNFATSPSSSDFDECHLDIATSSPVEEIQFSVQGAVQSDVNHFTFPQTGIHTIGAAYEIEDENSVFENHVEIHQTIYAGNYYSLSSPFVYEVLSDTPGDSQQLKLSFPNQSDKQATRWEIDGVTYTESVMTMSFAYNQPYEIKIFYTHNETGLEGSYTLQFDKGFPAGVPCEENETILTSPHIQLIWFISSPNFEKITMTYEYDGKTFTSETPLNSDPSSYFTVTANEDYTSTIDGKQAMKLGSRFSVKMVEVGNKNNVLELTDCVATFGFVSER